MNWQQITREGLWQRNPALVQLLGLCPLLAVSNTLINGLAMALATLLVLVLTETLVSASRHALASEIRIPAYVIVIASSVTVVELLMRAWLPTLDRTLGIFIPIITTNCLIIARAETCAARSPVPVALLDALMQGAGFGAVLVVLGAGRELLAHGCLLSDAARLFGPQAAGWKISLPYNPDLLIAVLPPGAFFGLGLLVAAHQALSRRRLRRAAPSSPPASAATPEQT